MKAEPLRCGACKLPVGPAPEWAFGPQVGRSVEVALGNLAEIQRAFSNHHCAESEAVQG